MMKPSPKVSELSDFMSLPENQYKAMKESFEQFPILKAISTIRKTNCYGCVDRSVDFEYPNVDDLLQMVKNMPYKLAEL